MVYLSFLEANLYKLAYVPAVRCFVHIIFVVNTEYEKLLL